MGPGLLRLLLSSLVVVHHFSSFALGACAVYIFFALSGYWIFEMWTKKYCSTKNPFITYIISRAWRIAPVFLFCSMLALLVVSFSFTVEPTKPFESLSLDTLFSSFFIFGYSTLSFMPLPPAWSIDIEMQFFLLAPLIIFALNRNPLIVALLIIIIGFISNNFGGSMILPTFIPWFLIGMLIAKYSDYVRSRDLGRQAGICVGLILTLFTLNPSLHPILFGGANKTPLFIKINPFFNIVVALISMPFVFATVFNRGGKFDRFFSDVSYSVYLFHWIPILVVSHYFPKINQMPFLLRLPFSLSMLLITYVVSIGITLWIDRPLNQLRFGFIRDRTIILK